jgi:hypothetical protein
VRRASPTPAALPPSSDPSGHLLPEGEGRASNAGRKALEPSRAALFSRPNHRQGHEKRERLVRGISTSFFPVKRGSGPCEAKGAAGVEGAERSEVTVPPPASPLRLAAGAAIHLPIKGEESVGRAPVKKRRTSRPPTHSSLAEMTHRWLAWGMWGEMACVPVLAVSENSTEIEHLSWLIYRLDLCRVHNRIALAIPLNLETVDLRFQILHSGSET